MEMTREQVERIVAMADFESGIDGEMILAHDQAQRTLLEWYRNDFEEACKLFPDWPISMVEGVKRQKAQLQQQAAALAAVIKAADEQSKRADEDRIIMSLSGDQVQQYAQQLTDAQATIQRLEHELEQYREVTPTLQDQEALCEQIQRLTEERDKWKDEAQRCLETYGDGLTLQQWAKERPHLTQRLATVEGVLKRLEWEHDGENERYCTHCGGWESQGHLTGCWFAQALAPAPGQEGGGT